MKSLDTKKLLKAIESSDLLSREQFKVVAFFYEYPNMTPNEIIQIVRKKYPEKSPRELMGINKVPSILKNRNILKVSEVRKCRISGNKSEALIPTYEMPIPKNQSVINSRYIDLGEQAMDGGMGIVRIAFDKETNQNVAFKQCKKGYEVRFNQELMVTLSLKHYPQIIKILDFNTSKKPFYYTMPLAKGDSMILIDDIQDISLQQDLFNSMLDCVEVIHNEGVLHRDIKPQNFLIFEKNKVVLADMGVARREPLDSGMTRITATGAPGGTEEFAPPEYHNDPRGFKNANETWDVYSLAKTFYRLLTNKKALFMEQGNIPEEIFKVLTIATEQDKSKRYSSIKEFKNHLNDAYLSISIQKRYPKSNRIIPLR